MGGAGLGSAGGALEGVFVRRETTSLPELALIEVPCVLMNH